jgi:hypothetical protein
MALEAALEKMRTELESGIKRQLSGLQGLVVKPVYNSMMPLHVEMSLVSQVYDFVFLKDGMVSLKPGSALTPDVRIESDPQTFMALFQNPSSELFNQLESESKIKITSLTEKGKQAEGYIRKHFAK